MPHATVFVHDVELLDDVEEFGVHKLPLNEDGELDEDADEYEWTITVAGDGNVTVTMPDSTSLSFSPTSSEFFRLAANNRSFFRFHN